LSKTMVDVLMIRCDWLRRYPTVDETHMYRPYIEAGGPGTNIW